MENEELRMLPLNIWSSFAYYISDPAGPVWDRRAWWHNTERARPPSGVRKRSGGAGPRSAPAESCTDALLYAGDASRSE